MKVINFIFTCGVSGIYYSQVYSYGPELVMYFSLKRNLGAIFLKSTSIE